MKEPPAFRVPPLAALVLVLVFGLPMLLACSGQIDGAPHLPGDPGYLPATGRTPGPGGVGPTTPDKPAAGPSGPSACGPVTAGPSPLRRLTNQEYDNTIRDLLGVNRPIARELDFPADARNLGFDNFAETQSPSLVLIERYGDAAEALAESAVKANLVSCRDGEGEEPCARRFIAEFGRRAYRRPLPQTETTKLLALYAAEKPRAGFAGAMATVVAAMLQSPHFLYRVELGRNGQPGALTGFELASRLSYALWATMPDDVLLDAAAAGKLDSAAGVAAQAERLLDDPRAKAAIARFHAQWLAFEDLGTLEKDQTVYPRFVPELRDRWRRETELFLEELVSGKGGTWQQFFVADHTFADATLAAFYGLPAPSGSGFGRIAVDGRKRAGFLTQGSFLAMRAKEDQSSPIDRAVFIREHLLCQHLPAPPNDLEISVPPLQPNLTTRERFAAHTAVPTCRSCHLLIDPLGYGLENYDGIGQWRDTDQGRPVDSAGELLGTEDVDGPFSGAHELSQRLARSDEARRCVVTQWFRFTHGRTETSADGCALQRLTEQFRRSGGNVRGLIVALTQSPAFLTRSPE